MAIISSICGISHHCIVNNAV